MHEMTIMPCTDHVYACTPNVHNRTRPPTINKYAQFKSKVRNDKNTLSTNLWVWYSCLKK